MASPGLAVAGTTHPPIADKLVMVDFDGTLVPWGPLMGPKEPEPGAVETLQLLKQKGYRIGIFTSRLSWTWAVSVVGRNHEAAVSFLREQEDYVGAVLRQHDIPFDFITDEKMPAEFYIDDKAIGYRGDWGLVREEVLGVSED